MSIPDVWIVLVSKAIAEGQRSAGGNVTFCRMWAVVCLFAAFVCRGGTEAQAVTRYVSLGGLHQPPFTNWVNAATTIQAAVEIATAGDLILVSNGVYETGGVVGPDGLTNRVFITKRLRLRSVGGRATIRGGEHTRCVYVNGGGRMKGFRFVEGRADGVATNAMRGGGVFVEGDTLFDHCEFVDNFASLDGGGAYGGRYTKCRFERNRVGSRDWYWSSMSFFDYGGGGAARAFLQNCYIQENVGGGLYACTAKVCKILANEPSGVQCCTLYDCHVAYNTQQGGGYGVLDSYAENCVIEYNGHPSTGYYYAAQYGGGAVRSVLVNTTLRHNYAYWGGGAYASVLSNCWVVSNEAFSAGGGVHRSILYNCFVGGNRAHFDAGGSYYSDLYNCTVVENHADWCGGALGGIAYNSIFWANQASRSSDGHIGTVNCFAGNPRLAGRWNPIPLASSPCVDAGTNQPWMETASDLSGKPRIHGERVDIGAFEFRPLDRTGSLEVVLSREPFAGITGVVFTLRAEIRGSPLNCTWDLGDGTVITGQTEATHAYEKEGEYVARFRAWNSHGEIVATQTVSVWGRDVYVAMSGDDANTGSDWMHAKKTIQGALDGMWPGADRILVSNGTYNTGGKAGPMGLTNRVYIDRPVRLESVNGPEQTIIVGQAAGTPNGLGADAVRCILALTQCWISGFTIYGGHTHTTAQYYCWAGYGRGVGGCVVTNDTAWNGGGIWCPETNVVISNCIFIANRAYAGGGAVKGGIVYNCVFVENEALCQGDSSSAGGACLDSFVYNSIFRRNKAALGGAIGRSYAWDCLFEENEAGCGGAMGGNEAHRCIFRNNKAAGGGGAAARGLVHVVGLYGYQYDYPISTAIYDSLFEGNSASWAGAVDTIDAFNSFFVSNVAIEGAVGLCSEFKNCLLAQNVASSRWFDLMGTFCNSTILENKTGEDIGLYTVFDNCIVVSNAFGYEPPWGSSIYPSHCCTIPLLSGEGNFDDDPQFVDYAAGDYRLASNSPCINRGVVQDWMFEVTDLAGQPRIQCGGVDVGAYESPYWGMHSDVDGDGVTDYGERYLAWTDPTNAASVLKVHGVANWVTEADPSGVVITWSSQTGRWYVVYRTTNLFSHEDYELMTRVAGCEGTTSVTDTTARVRGMAFYRVSVEDGK